MSVRTVLTSPNLRLSKVARPVEAVTPEICAILDDMLETMYQYQGIGLAAPQIGILKRMLVVDTQEDSGRVPLKVINPEIVWSSDQSSSFKEGCLSVPNHYVTIQRPAEIRMRYLSVSGESVEISASGLLATCLQHEIDHLNGILILDHDNTPH